MSRCQRMYNEPQKVIMMAKHVIHIGYPKAASTFLQKYFSAHPSINYDCMDFESFKRTGELDPSIKNKVIAENFRVLSDEALSIAGIKVNRADVVYQGLNNIKDHQRNTAEKLHHLFPNAKVLIIVRGYKSLLTSLYSQYLVKGGRLNFKHFIEEHGESFVEQFDYDYLYYLYLSIFGKSNVLMLPYEMLREAPEQFLTIIESFFEFPSYEMSSERVNKSIEVKYIPFILFISRMVYFSTKIFPKSMRIIIYGKHIEFLSYLNRKWLTSNKTSSTIDHMILSKDLLEKFKVKSDKIKSEKFILNYSRFY